jgi:hypothetical protein
MYKEMFDLELKFCYCKYSARRENLKEQRAKTKGNNLG